MSQSLFYSLSSFELLEVAVTTVQIKVFFFFKLLGTAKRKTAASLPPKNKNEPHRWGLYHNNTDCLELTKSLHMFESLMVFPLELFHIITSCGQAHDAL